MKPIFERSRPAFEWDSPFFLIDIEISLRKDLKREEGKEVLKPSIEELEGIRAARLIGRFWNGREKD